MNLDLGVISTKYILEGAPILHVAKDEDGDWQFLGRQEITEADAVVVSLGQILKIDETIKAILDMPKGAEVKRQDVNSPWVLCE